MNKTHKITPEWAKSICDDYQTMKSNDVARKHNIIDATVLAVIRKAGLMSKRDRVKVLPEKEVIALYLARTPAPDIAEKYGVNYNSIYRILARNNIPVSKSFMDKGRLAESESPNWVGDEAKYRTVHTFVRRKINDGVCSKCGESGLSGKKIHTANLTGIYSRDPKDYAMMCIKCHRKFDSERRRK